MNNNLQTILDITSKSDSFGEEEKVIITKAAKSVDNELTIALFKLDRTEKVKRTTGILLEETIEELEQKRKAVEEQAEVIRVENERKSIELEEARQLQLAMLPKELPQLPNLDIAVFMQTATEVGGDYYDFHVKDDKTLLTVIGDATGHGLKAGTIVTITKSLFHSLASEKDILSSFSEISRVIKGMNFRQLSMCLIMMEIKDNILSISSAAMPSALIYRNKDKSVEELLFQGMPLGSIKNFPYQLKETELKTGDTIFLFTDGLPELTNRKNEMYGYDRTKSKFISVGEKHPKEIVHQFKNSALDWAEGNDPEDDVTFVVIKVK